MDIIKTIRAEIERLKEVLSDPLMRINGPDYIAGGRKIANTLLSFLDTLETPKVDCFKIKGWVARDACGRVCLFLNRPHLNPKWRDAYEDENDVNSIIITNLLYEEPQMPWLTFENSPIEVELLIKKI